MIPAKTSTWQPWVVVLSASLFFFFAFVQANMFNAIDAALIKEFSVSAAKLGELSAMYFYGNVVMLLPAGILLDRFSTRRVILLAFGVMLISTVIFATTKQFYISEICRFVIGIMSTFCLLSNVRLASRWFKPERLALVIGIIITIAMFGGMVAQTPMTVLVGHFGWRETILFVSALGIAIWLLIFAVVHNHPAGAEKMIAKQSEHLNAMGFWVSLKKCLTNLQNWLAGTYTCFLNLPIFLLGAMWGGLYLVQVHHLTSIQASYVTTMLFVGAIIGFPVIGWLSDRITQRRSPMIIGAIISLAVILTIMYMPGLGLWSLLFLFLCLGFFTSTQGLGYPLIAESNAPALTGTANGLASTLIMGGGIFQPVFGWLLGMEWHHHYVHQVPVYSPHSYLMAMSILPIGFTLGLIAALLLRETHCKQTA